MSEKLRIQQIHNAEAEGEANNAMLRYQVQKCNPGAPWSPIATFEGPDKSTVLKNLTEKYPKARFR